MCWKMQTSKSICRVHIKGDSQNGPLRGPFPCPSRVGGILKTHQTDYSGTNKHTGTNKHYSGTNKHDSETNKHTKKKSQHAKNFFVCALILTQIVLKHFPCHGGSKYVLRFEIESREGGFYSGRTHTQTDRHTHRDWEIII